MARDEFSRDRGDIRITKCAPFCNSINPGTQDRESIVQSEINQTDINTYFEKH
jgi:hypothetical protein